MLVPRIITGLVLGVVITASILFLQTAYMAGVLALLWVAGAWEWGGLAKLGGVGRSIYAALFVLALSVLAWQPLSRSAVDVVLIVALAGWALALVGILTFPRPIALTAVVAAGPLALLPAWVTLVFVHASSGRGPELALLAMALVWAADVGAYAAGRLVGRVKLAPRVSPGKTWEGVGGGVLLALVVASAASVWLALALLPLLAVAAATALVSVVGDLTVSMLKRNVGLKDTGRLLPGHGGVMDRIDGLIAAVPVYAAGLRITGLVG
ncbi:MAG TPA: phosphatidate cytidylyltransferase [Gammaproteobacteria bacterium]